jgi:cell wall assembly regulator SMI1
MTSEYVLPFDKKGKEMKVNGINFLSIDTSAMLKTDAEKVYKSDAASRIFHLLCGLIAFPEPQIALQLSLFLNHSEGNIQNLGVLFLDDGTILPVRFTESEGFNFFCETLMLNTSESYYFIINPSTCKGHPCNNYITRHDPFKELGSWITKIAPKGFAKLHDHFLKEQYLNRFIQMNPPEAEVNLNLLANRWRDLIQLKQLEGNVPLCYTIVYDAFKDETGMDFPEALKTIYALNNGVEKFVNGAEFLSAEDVLQEWKNWNVIYNCSLLSELLENNTHGSDCMQAIPMSISPYRIPFLHDGGGNFVAVDLLPNSAGKKGQIIAFGVDEIEIRYVAENMLEFLEQFFERKLPKDVKEPLPRGIIGLSKYAWLNNILF